MPKLECVGVIGAGVMGVGVAQNLVQTRHRVILVDVSDQIFEQAKTELRKNLRLARMLNKAPGQESLDEILARVTYTTDYGLLDQADFIVENVVEQWHVKQEIYPRLDAVCQPHCVFAANTSCIPITRLGALTGRPDRVLGIHFMNPVPLKPTVELL